jgi:hypothetical protein
MLGAATPRSLKGVLLVRPWYTCAVVAAGPTPRNSRSSFKALAKETPRAGYRQSLFVIFCHAWRRTAMVFDLRKVNQSTSDLCPGNSS